MKIKNPKWNYTLKTDGKKVERYETKSKIRFLRKMRLLNWKDEALKVYIRVSYGYKLLGMTAYNDGTYNNKKDFNQALNAFLE